MPLDDGPATVNGSAHANASVSPSRADGHGVDELASKVRNVGLGVSERS